MRQIPIVLALCLQSYLSGIQSAGVIAQDEATLTAVSTGADWTQWGGINARMNTPVGKSIPTHWNVGEKVPWKNSDLRKGYQPMGSLNIKWAVQLGSETYGNPVVAGGKVFVGTNNGAGYLDRYPPEIDLGVLLCFEEATGNFLWQHSNPKLKSGRVHDWPNQGVCSTPVVDGNRLWYVSNRGEIVCLDTEGHYDSEDDGPEQDFVQLLELDAFVHGQVKTWTSDYSMPKSIRAEFTRLGLPLPRSHGLTTVEDNRSWTVVEHIRDERNRIVERKPMYRVLWEEEFVRVERITFANGQAVYEEQFRVADQLIAGLGTPQVVAGIKAGLEGQRIAVDENYQPQTLIEGKLWSFRGVKEGKNRQFRVRLQGTSLRLEMLQVPDKEVADVVWRFDMMKELGVSQHNMATCSMLPVDGVLFVCTSNGVDESHVNIPAPQAPPNPDSAVVWHYAGRDLNEFEGTFHRSLSTPVIQDDILYAADFSGLLHCLHAKTGKVFWTYDCYAACWSSPMLVDGKVYMADEDGEVAIFRHTAKPQVAHYPAVNNASDYEKLHQKLIQDGVMINECQCQTAIYTTPIVANNVLYIATRNALYALDESGKQGEVSESR